MSVVVVATIRPLPDHRDEVIEALRSAVGQVHGEDGCELYALHEAPDRLVMVEKWASREALAVHGKGPALVSLGQALAGKVAGPSDVIVLDPVPAGESAKGTL
jgi:quinol monooxygenase YgiN